MKTQKDRRHNGYVTPDATVPPKEVYLYDWFINEYYSDWDDYRDGFRDWYRDGKLIKKIQHRRSVFEDLVWTRERMNTKQRKLLHRRKKRALSPRNK